MEEDKAAEASTWLASDTALWIGGALVVAVTIGGVVWLTVRPNSRKGRQRRQKTKKEMWRSERMPMEHLRFLYSALGSNPLDCEVLTLFCDSYGGSVHPSITRQSNKEIFANEELVQLTIEKLRGLLEVPHRAERNQASSSEEKEKEKENENEKEKGTDEGESSAQNDAQEEHIASLLSFAATLTLIDTNSITFLNEGGLSSVLHCIEKFPAPSLATVACGIVGSLCQHAPIEEAQLQHIVSCIMQVLVQNPSPSTPLLLEATNVLKTVLRNANASLAKLQDNTAIATGLIPLIEVLKSKKNDYRVILNTISSLRYLIQDHEKNRGRAIELGLLPVLASIADTYTADPITMEAILWLTKNITSHDTSKMAVTELKRLGIEPPLRRSVNTFSNSNKEIERVGRELEQTFNW